MCRKSKVAFIGPDAEAMEKMGDKLMARMIMAGADVPVIPGSMTRSRTPRDAERIAERWATP
jgi:acetyl-CoA carboxylase biotin carboxylase subunit